MTRDEYLRQLEEAIANDELDDDAIDARMNIAESMRVDKPAERKQTDK